MSSSAASESPSRMPVADVRVWAERAGIRISDEELPQYEVLLEMLFAGLEAFGAVPPAEPPVVAAVRDAAPAEPPADPLNAVVRWCRVAAEGVEGPLSGTRVAVKDNIAIAGIPLSGGSAFLKDYVPRADSVVVERLLRAGAEIVAVTNMDALALSGGGETSAFGPTRNPWDATRATAGSSSGSAAALFYDEVDVAIGTDDGGSIRVPAAWCGVLGLKPTHGLVPYTGIIASDHVFSHAGPLARNVIDLARTLDAIAGADEERSDPRQRELVPDDYVGAVERAPGDLAGVRLGYVEQGFAAEAGVEPETAEATMEALERMRAAGADVRPVSVPEHLTAGGVALSLFVEGATAMIAGFGNGYHWDGRYSVDLAAAIAEARAERMDELPPTGKAMLTAGEFLREQLNSRLYFTAQTLRAPLRAAYDRALEQVDFLVMPTATTRPHPLAGPDMPLAERVLRGWGFLGNATPFNVTGHPSISLPAGASGGLPVGVMLTGARFTEAPLLAFARTYERLHGWLPDGAPSALGGSTA